MSVSYLPEVFGRLFLSLALGEGQLVHVFTLSQLPARRGPPKSGLKNTVINLFIHLYCPLVAECFLMLSILTQIP